MLNDRDFYSNMNGSMPSINAAELDRMQQRLDAARSKLATSNVQGVPNTPSLWETLEAEVTSLSDIQFKTLIDSNPEYVATENMLQATVNKALMSFIKPYLLQNKDVIAALGAQIARVKDFKKKQAEAQDSLTAAMQEYIKNYSQVPYSEYAEAVKNGTLETLKQKIDGINASKK